MTAKNVYLQFGLNLQQSLELDLFQKFASTLFQSVWHFTAGINRSDSAIENYVAERIFGGASVVLLNFREKIASDGET